MKTQYLRNTLLLLLNCAFLVRIPNPVSAQTVQVNVDWNTTVGEVNPKIWGVNDEQIRIPASAANVGFNRYMTQLNPELIRVHHASLTDLWTNSTTRTWDVARIKAGFENATGYGDARILLNIPKWPSWLAPTGAALPADKEEEFIKLCTDLVLIMRDSVKREVAYWEIINEREGLYEKAGRLPDLWNLVNKIAAGIRAIDPDTKVGGPALTWPNPAWVESFMNDCAPNLDFVSWHNYASGTPTTSNDKLFFDLLDQIEGNTKYIMGALQQRGLQKEAFLTEFNVQWTWDPFEIRHTNHVGAVFQACYVRRAAVHGVTGANVWHVKGNAYGLIDGNNNQRATGSLYNWGNQYVHGRLAASSVADSTVEVLPVLLPNGKRSLLLMNKTPRTVNVPGGGNLLVPAGGETLRSMQINEGGMLPETITVTPGDLALAPYSVTLITTAIEDSQVPAAPTAPKATAITDNSVSLSWTASAGSANVIGYDLYHGSTKMNSSIITTTTYAASWLNAGTDYTFTVKAKGPTGLESPASAPVSVTTLPFVARPGSAILTLSSLENTFSGNVVNDTVQTTTAASRVTIRQNAELRLDAADLPQYEHVYVTTFKRPISLAANATFSVKIKSSAKVNLRVKLFDDTGKEVDNGQNTLYLAGDNVYRTQRLDFARAGFGAVNARSIKGIKISNFNGGSLDAVIFMDDLKLGIKLDDVEPPTAPTGLVASDITPHSAALRWTAATDNKGVDGYNVYAGSTKLNASLLTTPQYTVTWLESDTTYAFTVRARDLVGNESVGSAPLAVTTLPFVARPGSATLTPTSLVNDFPGNVINDTVQITSANSPVTLKQNEELRLTLNDVDQYKNVYVTTLQRPIDLTANAVFSVDLKSNLPVNLRVKLVDDQGKSVDNSKFTLYVKGTNAYATFTLDFAGGFGAINPRSIKQIRLMSVSNSDSAAVLFMDHLRLGEPDALAPSAPGDLAAASVAPNQVDLRWTAATDNTAVFAYDVYNGAAWMGSTTGTTYAAAGLTSAQTYTFSVKARDESGNASLASNVVTVTTPDNVPPTAPAQLAAGSVTPYGLTLSWQAAADNAAVTGYEVYRDGTKVNAALITGTQLSIAGLTASTGYTFTVKALDAAGNESEASVLAVTTLPPASTTYEAEDAALSGARVRTALKHYSGSGYVQLLASKGNSIEWQVNGIFAGSYVLTFRYIRNDDDNTGEDAYLSLSVNGNVINKQLVFPATLSSGGWQTVTLSASLLKGANTIRLTALGGATPPVDYLLVTDPTQAPAAQPQARNAAASAPMLWATGPVQLSLFPNPATDGVTLHIRAKEAGPARVMLTDVFSRKAKESDFWLQAGTNTVRMQVNDLPGGVYVVTVSSGGGLTTKKLQVSR